MALANSRDATRDALVVFDDGAGCSRALAIPSRALAALTRNSDHAAAHRRVAVAARRLDVAARHHARLASSADHLDDAWSRARRRAETCARPARSSSSSRNASTPTRARESASCASSRRRSGRSRTPRDDEPSRTRTSGPRTSSSASPTPGPTTGRPTTTTEKSKPTPRVRGRTRRAPAATRGERETRRARVGSEIVRRVEAALAGEPSGTDDPPPTGRPGRIRIDDPLSTRARARAPPPPKMTSVVENGDGGFRIECVGADSWVPTCGVPTRNGGPSPADPTLRTSVAATVAASPSPRDGEGTPIGEPSAPSAPSFDFISNHTRGAVCNRRRRRRRPRPQRRQRIRRRARRRPRRRRHTETQSRPVHATREAATTTARIVSPRDTCRLITRGIARGWIGSFATNGISVFHHSPPISIPSAMVYSPANTLYPVRERVELRSEPRDRHLEHGDEFRPLEFLRRVGVDGIVEIDADPNEHHLPESPGEGKRGSPHAGARRSRRRRRRTRLLFEFSDGGLFR